jgi:non-specific serine/threonine protein kinase
MVHRGARAFPTDVRLDEDLPELVSHFRRWLATSLVHLAERAIEQGSTQEATSLLLESIALFGHCDDSQGLLLCLDRMAVSAGKDDQFDRVVHLYALADGIREVRALRDAREESARDLQSELLDLACQRLGRRPLAAIAQFARSLAKQAAAKPPERNLRRLLDHIEPKPATPALTAREWEVAKLIAEGKTNAQIAEALVISRGTVMVHVKHILARLGMSSRAQIAAWSVQAAAVLS